MKKLKVNILSLLTLIGFVYLFNTLNVSAQEQFYTGNVSDTKNEIATPEIIETTPQNFEIEIAPNLTINVPNTDHVPYFMAKIRLKASGIASVNENFYIVVTENNSKTPFYREYPKSVETPIGNIKTNIDILKATHNKSFIPCKIESTINSNKVFFGNSEKGLTPGVHHFSINYQIPSALQTMGNDKLLAISIVGKGWNVPITRTIATLQHPTLVFPKGQTVYFDDIPDDKIKIYTNPNDTYSLFKGDIINPFQNLILLETFSADNIGNLSFLTKFKHFINTNMTTLIYFLGFVFVFIYYLISWFTIDKEERKIINPAVANNNLRFFSPAAFRIFLKKTIDARTIATILISLACKGLIKIEEKQPSSFSLIRQVNTDKKIIVSDGEKRILNLLFPKGILSTQIDDKLGKKLTKYRKNFEVPLKKEYDKQYLKMNISYFIFGIFVLLATLIIAALASNNILWVLLTSMSMTITFFIMISSFNIISQIFKTPAYKESKIKLSLLFITFTLTTIASFACLYIIYLNVNFLAAIFLALMLLCISSAYHLLKKDTKLGRIINTSSKLYESFLNQNPTPFLNLLSNNTKAQNLFMSHLPYAVALDYEDKWTTRFQGVLNANEEYLIPWYSGEEKFSPDFVKNLVNRIIKILEDNCTFLNPKIQRFR